MTKSRRKIDEADSYLRWADIAAATTLTVIIASQWLYYAGLGKNADAVPNAIKLFALALVILFIIAIRNLFRRRRRDEYLEGLWNAGTSASFLATCSYALLAFFARIVANANAKINHTTIPQWVDHMPNRFLLVSVIAFLVGFNLKRFRGR